MDAAVIQANRAGRREEATVRAIQNLKAKVAAVLD
jgi:hypothetical protein